MRIRNVQKYTHYIHSAAANIPRDMELPADGAYHVFINTVCSRRPQEIIVAKYDFRLF